MKDRTQQTLQLVIVWLCVSIVSRRFSMPIVEAHSSAASLPRPTVGRGQLLQPWTLLENTVLPTKTQMSGVAQLGPFTAIVGGCLDIGCHQFSDAIMLFDPLTNRMWSPLLGHWNASDIATPSPTAAPQSQTNSPASGRVTTPPSASTNSTNQSSAEEEGPTNSYHEEASNEKDTVARLKYPIAGLHSVVGLGNSLFVMGMCSFLPTHNITEMAKVVDGDDYYRKIQRIILLDVGDGVSVPPRVAVLSEYTTTSASHARVNASCIGHGRNSLYIVGGVGYDATSRAWALRAEADELNVDLMGTVNASARAVSGVFRITAVCNPSLVSDADLIYIIGGTLGSGQTSETVVVYYVPQGSVIPLTDYPHVPALLQSAVLHTTVIAGNIIVTGDNYRTFETFYQIDPVDGWIYSENRLLPVRNATTWAYPFEGGMLLILFGGHNSVSLEVTDEVWTTVLTFENPAVTGFIQTPRDGVAYWNDSISIVFGPGYHTRDFDHCNETTCTVRVGLSERCDTSFFDLPFHADNLTNVTINGSLYVETVSVTLPSTTELSMLDEDVPHFLYACYSAGKVGQPPSCAGEECLYEASFYVPLNALNPVTLERRPPPPPALPSPWTTQKIVLVAVISTILVIIAAVVVKVYCCSGRSSATGKGKDPSGPPAGVLGDGRYKVVERLGRGSFSVVYLVERSADKRKFALKYIQCPDETERREAMKECEVIAKLRNHPNVIHLEDMFLSYKFDSLSPSERNDKAGRPSAYQDSPLLGDIQSSQKSLGAERYLSLVMEYHDRGDLSKWVRRMKSMKTRIPEATIISIAHQVCSVLNYMHTQSPPILHRDLKPENLLLSSVFYNNVADTFLPIIVSDFGLSRVMDKAFCETGVGSLPYVAPECWKRSYTTKIDLWATGCILFALCARRVEADNVVVMFSESNRPDFASFIFGAITKTYGYSPELAHFIGMLLEVDVNRRPSAEQALDCIKRRVIATEVGLGGSSNRSNSDSGFGSGDADPQGRRGSSAGYNSAGRRFSSDRLSSSSEAVFEHYLIDMEAQEEIRSSSPVGSGKNLLSRNVASPLKKIKRPNSRQNMKQPGGSSQAPSQRSSLTPSSNTSPKNGAYKAQGEGNTSEGTTESNSPVLPPTPTLAPPAADTLPQSMRSVELNTHHDEGSERSYSPIEPSPTHQRAEGEGEVAEKDQS